MIPLDRDPFLLLEGAVQEVALAMRPLPVARAELPEIRGGPPRPAEIVELGEALAAVLTAVASARRGLRQAEAPVALGAAPLELQLNGELVGWSQETLQVRVRIGGSTARAKPEEKSHGQG